MIYLGINLKKIENIRVHELWSAYESITRNDM
jgi:hypothetical protein